MDSLADVDTLSEVIPTCPNCRKEDRGSNEYARWSNLTASKDLRFVTDVIDDKGFSLEAGERQQDLELRQIFFRVDSAFDNVNELRGAMDRLERYQEERERRDPTVNSDCLGSLDRGMYLLWHGFGGCTGKHPFIPTFEAVLPSNDMDKMVPPTDLSHSSDSGSKDVEGVLTEEDMSD